MIARTAATTGTATDETTGAETHVAVREATGTAEGNAIEGLPTPPGTELMSSTPQALSLRTTAEVIPFFRKQVAGKTGITTTETEVDGLPYFVVSAEGHKLPFSALALMKTPDFLKPASGDWVQISITK